MTEANRIDDFFKPTCPVRVGDRFYRNYHVPNKNNWGLVEEIEEARDENGTYYILTVRYVNMRLGNNVKKLSSRALTPENYTILKKGVDF